MSYFFGFPSLFTYEEKEASSVKSTEEEKFTNGREEQNEQEESEDIMGSASRKGWLDWQFWKKSETSNGPFGAFRKSNKNTGASTTRKELSGGNGEGSKASGGGGEEGQRKASEILTKTDRASNDARGFARYVRILRRSA